MEKTTPDLVVLHVLQEGPVTEAVRAIETLAPEDYLDFIEEIPVLRILAGLYKAGVDLKSYLFLRKLARFVHCIHEIPEADRTRFLQSLDEDPKTKKRVAEGVFLLLERLDDLEKPTLVARALGAYVAQQIDYTTFRRFCMAIDKSFLPDLHFLAATPGFLDLPEEVGLNLVTCGLVAPGKSRGHSMTEGNDLYCTTEFGRQFCRLVVSASDTNV